MKTVVFQSDSLLNTSIEHINVFGRMPREVFNKTTQWRKARYHALKILGNRCQLCGASGQNGSPLCVDHIKPRHLYPELCLDLSNLQILCTDCHIAKGDKHEDDFTGNYTQVEPARMRDFFRINRTHLLLDSRVLKSRIEVSTLSSGVRAISKKHRKRWRALVDFCFRNKCLYREAIAVTVGEVINAKNYADHRLIKFTKWGEKGDKSTDDILFDINGCLFPESIYELLADDEI